MSTPVIDELPPGRWLANARDADVEPGDQSAAGEREGIDGLFRTQVENVPQFGEYEKQAGRVIPVIVLTPR